MEQLILKAQQGEQTAWDTLYRNYTPLLKSLSSRFSGIEFEEAFAESSLVFFQVVQKFNPEIGVYFGYYLKRQIIGHLSNLQRKNKEYQKANIIFNYSNSEEKDWWERVEAKPDTDHLLITDLKKILTKREYLATYLYWYQGWSTEEISKALKVSVETVKTWRKRSLKKMRKFLSPEIA